MAQFRWKRNDFIKAINKRSKLEITVNNICGNCTKNCQKDCIVKEHNNLYNFSNANICKCEEKVVKQL